MDIKKEKIIINALKKILSKPKKCLGQHYADIHPYLIAINTLNIIAIKSKSEFGKEILRQFLPENYQKSVIFNNLKYTYPKLTITKTKFMTQYIKQVIDFFNCYSKIKDEYENKITFDLDYDFPLKIENDDFEFIIAPVIEDKNGKN